MVVRGCRGLYLIFSVTLPPVPNIDAVHFYAHQRAFDKSIYFRNGLLDVRSLPVHKFGAHRRIFITNKSYPVGLEVVGEDVAGFLIDFFDFKRLVINPVAISRDVNLGSDLTRRSG